MTNSTRYELTISTNPSDFGYGATPAPSDTELFDRQGSDVTGTVARVGKYLSEQAQRLGGTMYRVAIREQVSQQSVPRHEFAEMYQSHLYDKAV